MTKDHDRKTIFFVFKIFSDFFQGYLINYNETAGILPIDDLLTINRIEITSDGDYSCAATNSEGETYSAPLNLLVQCK